jgi:transcriptional regulator with PAS, ATPase and Fis domain
VISVTNLDLEQEGQQKRFREDLYYRISVFPIHVPPLRERREDIPLLGSRVLRYSKTKLGKQVQGISSRALEWLVHYQWPGNVRALENESSAVVLVPDGGSITPDYLSERLTSQNAVRVHVPTEAPSLK